LLLRQWLVQSEASSGQKKLAVTDKGLVFLDKWVELQKMVGIKSKRKSMFHESKIQPVTAK
jgi:predicted transcriptional regulator